MRRNVCIAARHAFGQITFVAASMVGAAACTAGPVESIEAAASQRVTDSLAEDEDDTGSIETDSTGAFSAGPSNGFFASLGTNGRTCNTCHVESAGWTFTPAQAQSLGRSDPLFAPVDGADCPPTAPGQSPDSQLSSELLGYGLIRVQIALPAGADFSLASATNPKSCAVAPGSPAIGGQLFLFRRPLPSTNLVFDSTIMWDGRETLQKISTTAGEQDEAPLLADLSSQANDATMGHAQGASIADTQAQSDVVAFETALFTAQSKMQFQGVRTTGDGANGGAEYVADVIGPAFNVGVNDPLSPAAGGFTNAIFDVYRAWEPTSSTYASLKKSEQAIGRGEAIFNGTTFTIHDVPGLNSTPDDPLYNPADPLAGQDIVGGCGVCHNNPDVGNHSAPLAINIGVTMAQPTNNDGSANTVLDLASLPVYTLSGAGGAVSVTDPARALISGRFVDIGKTKGPNLRGLSARAPYFHNGSAKDLATVVAFYDQRFQIGFTPAQVSDLVAFLQAL